MYSLRQLFKRTGGDQTARIVEVLKGTPNDIDKFAKALSNAVNFGVFSTIILWLASSSLRLLLSLGSDRFVEEAVRWLINFRVDCRDIEDALCLQKHAFNFIYLRRLKEACEVHISLWKIWEYRWWQPCIRRHSFKLVSTGSEFCAMNVNSPYFLSRLTSGCGSKGSANIQWPASKISEAALSKRHWWTQIVLHKK